MMDSHDVDFIEHFDHLDKESLEKCATATPDNLNVPSESQESCLIQESNLTLSSDRLGPLTSSIGSASRCSEFKYVDFNLSKESYKMTDLLEWARHNLSEYKKTKRSSLTIREHHVKYSQVEKVPQTSRDLCSHACIVDCSATVDCSELCSLEPDELTASPTGIRKNFKIPKSERTKIDNWLASNPHNHPADTIFIGYLGTDWKSRGKNFVKPIKAWCFYVIPSSAIEKYSATETWPWHSGAGWRHTLGPCICVALPHDEKTVPPEDPQHVTSEAQRKRSSRQINLDEISEYLVDFLIQERGFLSQAHGSAFNSQRAELRLEVQSRLRAMVDGLAPSRERWPDYVFDDDFVCPNLRSILEFARKHKHLQGVVSESRVDSGDFDAHREIASVLKYVEMMVIHLNDHADQLTQLRSRQDGGDDGDVGKRDRPAGTVGQRAEEGLESRMVLLDLYAAERASPLGGAPRLEIRPYQAACVAQCLAANAIIALPTGAGKSLIAVRVIDLFSARDPGRCALFVAPTRALVAQQAGYIRAHAAQQPRVVELCGTATDGWGRGEWEACLAGRGVLVGTPEVFRRGMVDLGYFDAGRLSVLILDECHNATGNSPMAAILLDGVRRAPPEARPRIVGLTASFVNGALGDVTEKRRRLEGLLAAEIYCPEVPADAVAGGGGDRGGSRFQQVVFVREADEDALREMAERWVARLLDPLADLLRIVKTDKLARDAGHVLVEAGRAALLAYICDGLAPAVQAKAEVIAARANADGNKRLGLSARAIVDNLPRIQRMLAANAAELRRDGSAVRAPEVSAKAVLLREVVGAQFDSTPGAKGIIFVEQVALAYPLARAVEACGVAAGHVVGAGAMADRDREAVLDRFRLGSLRLLVCTAALEEGIDVSDCDFVVRYNRFATTKSHIQGSGRARAPNARVFYFDNDPDAERAGEAELARVARDPELGLRADEREARRAAPAGPRVGPHPFAEPAGSGEVSIYNALALVMGYCSRVMRQSVSREDICHYLVSPAQPGQAEPRTLTKVVYPGPDGPVAVGRAAVMELWGDADMVRVVDQVRWGTGRTAAELDEARFFFAVAVAMRRAGHLDDHNQPGPVALARSHDACPAFPAVDGVRLAPRFPAAAASAAAPSTPPTSLRQRAASGSPASPGGSPAGGDSDFKSQLNVLGTTRWRRSDSLRYTVAGTGPFVATVELAETGARFTGSPQPTKRAAEQRAAELAVLSLRSGDSDPSRSALLP